MDVLGRVLGVQTGRVADLPYRGGVVRSAFVKTPVAGPVAIGRLGLAGDEQGDLKAHGGVDKAACVYPDEHYPALARCVGRPLGPAAAGENLTTRGVVEEDVCIGDRLRIGTALLEVSVPRSPCYRLASRYGRPDLPRWVERTGASGFYLRVIEPGELAAGAAIELVERRHPDVTVAAVNRARYGRERDAARLRALLVPELGDSWRRALERRAAGAADPSSELRRFGPAGAPAPDGAA